MIHDVHRRARAAIAEHFAGAASPAAEREMRAHLPTCADCHQLYERHLLLASLDPAGVPIETRLARGLGLRPAPVPHRAFFGWLSLCGAAAAAVILVQASRGGPSSRVIHETPAAAAPAPGEANVAGVVARGGSTNIAAALMPELEIYRIFTGRRGTSTAEKASDFVYAGDELAFAYRNPAGKHWLMVFAVDQHEHVYWYYPGWSDVMQNPTGVSISAEPGLHELRSAVFHKFDGERIMIHALFTDRELSVRQVEEVVAAAQSGRSSGAPEPLAIPGAIDVVQSLRVIR